MLIIPERKIVVLLVPRTGTDYLIRRVTDRYPNASLAYRHMEIEGLPSRYIEAEYSIYGIIREPVERMWSLYKSLSAPKRRGGCIDDVRTQQLIYNAEAPFSTWLVRNDIPLCTPYLTSGGFDPRYDVKHILPENKKSQSWYFRPDLPVGDLVKLVPYTKYTNFCEFLDLDITRRPTRTTPEVSIPKLTPNAVNHLSEYFRWDFDTYWAQEAHWAKRKLF